MCDAPAALGEGVHRRGPHQGGPGGASSPPARRGGGAGWGGRGGRGGGEPGGGPPKGGAGVTAPPAVTAVDWIIVAFTLLMAGWGFAQGLIVGALSLAGFVGGALLGSRL